ncbi:MAG: sodium-dependent transporter [Calditrichaeota bacterium]|nr:sodium-dependent transporter [Calditrichota bacterium]
MEGEYIPREHWGSRTAFIMAAGGSAIGLGNIWKFPYITGVYGGAAFVMWYLFSILMIGLPVMLIEYAIGRRTQRSPVGAFKALAPGTFYWLIGAMGVLAGFIILSYYSVIAGWTLAYIFKALFGGFAGFHSPEVARQAFEAYATHPIRPLLTHAVFMFLVILIVYQGVKKGIERWNSILMPLLAVIVIVLAVRGITLKGVEAHLSALNGLKFLFAPDFTKLTGNGMLVAMGHAFFTLSLGMGAMLTYGSYLSERENLIKSALWVIVMDTAFALLAGVAIFTTVFALGFQPGSGPGLIFNVLPAIFAVMPGGGIMGVLFFLLLSIAALTSAISLLEVVTAYFVEQRGWVRHRAAVVWGIAIFLLGVPPALSFGVLGNIKLLGMTLFDLFDYLSFKYMLPLGGLFMVLFTIIRWKPVSLLQELRKGGSALRISNGAALALLIVSALFVAITFIAGLFGKN